MHFKKIIIVAALVLTSSYYTAHAANEYKVKPIERTSIEQHKEIIARELRYNCLQRYTLISVGTVAATLALYKMFGHYLPQEGIIANVHEKLSGAAPTFNPMNWLKKLRYNLPIMSENVRQKLQ